jgi:hypothetical protein
MNLDPSQDPSSGENRRDHWRRDLKESLRDSLPRRGSVSARLVVGLTVVALGIIYLAGSLDIIDTRAPLRYFWPALFCALGGAMLIAPRAGVDGKPAGIADRRWGFVWLFIGLWGFAYHFHWVDIWFWDIAFPLLLLFVGVRLVQRAMNPVPPTVDGQSQPTDEKSHRVFAFLSGSEVRTYTQPIQSAEAVAILSGIKLDLTSAQIEGDRATLDVTAVMGGIEIYAPSDWKIVSDVMPILGAYVDKRRPTAVVPTKTLFIGGLVLMGGVEVKN